MEIGIRQVITKPLLFRSSNTNTRAHERRHLDIRRQRNAILSIFCRELVLLAGSTLF